MSQVLSWAFTPNSHVLFHFMFLPAQHPVRPAVPILQMKKARLVGYVRMFLNNLSRSCEEEITLSMVPQCQAEALGTEAQPPSAQNNMFGETKRTLLRFLL